MRVNKMLCNIFNLYSILDNVIRSTFFSIILDKIGFIEYNDYLTIYNKGSDLIFSTLM